MSQKVDVTYLSPQSFILHELHPACGLNIEILNRLINTFLDQNLSKRRISKQALLQTVELHPVTVVGTPKKPLVIGGWAISHALKLYNVDDPVPCIARWKLPKSKIHTIALADFFIGSSLEKHDEMAHRIRASCMNKHIEDAELKELLSVDCKTAEKFFQLPIRKGKTLERDLLKENSFVRDFILPLNDTSVESKATEKKSIKSTSTNDTEQSIKHVDDKDQEPSPDQGIHPHSDQALENNVEDSPSADAQQSNLFEDD